LSALYDADVLRGRGSFNFGQNPWNNADLKYEIRKLRTSLTHIACLACRLLLLPVPPPSGPSALCCCVGCAWRLLLF